MKDRTKFLLRGVGGFSLFFIILAFLFISCSDDDDPTGSIVGVWLQQGVTTDGISTITDCEKNLTLFFEANGIYRMFDPCSNKEHAGTWLFSDDNLLNMSMDKIIGKEISGDYRFGQVLVRFTILSVTGDEMQLRIKTFAGERKATVMFSLAEQDPTPATPEEALELDTENKLLHTYIYTFKRIQM